MITSEDFGTIEGRTVSRFTLTNDAGWIARITDYGGILTEVHVPDREGELADVTLGFDTLAGYLGPHPHFGGLIGRVGNRIAGARFTLDGKTYQLAANEAPNHLHGGPGGFDKLVWDAEAAETDTGPALKLSHLSADGEEGYPGNLDVTAVYTLGADFLALDYTATTDAPTVVNLTHHAYWNLAGHAAGDVLGQTLRLDADATTPTGPGLIPTGEIAPVAGTPYDFRNEKTIGRDSALLASTIGGYDANFVVNGFTGELRPVAEACDPVSGRVLTQSTTEPGLQLYSGFKIKDGLQGKGGGRYGPCSGFCLEPQKFPDAPNRPEFPSCVLRPGETYRNSIVWRFSIRG